MLVRLAATDFAVTTAGMSHEKSVMGGLKFDEDEGRIVTP